MTRSPFGSVRIYPLGWLASYLIVISDRNQPSLEYSLFSDKGRDASFEESNTSTKQDQTKDKSSESTFW
jgi:hypothetical protein